MRCIFYVEVHWVAFLLILPPFIDHFISLLQGIRLGHTSDLRQATFGSQEAVAVLVSPVSVLDL